jgi:ComF family protein
LHQIKYKKNIALGERLAESLCSLFEAQDWPIEIVVPVPLGIARFKERGYNQAALIARPLSLAFDLHYAPHALQRTRETHSQVGLNLSQRKMNVKDAFKARPDVVSRRNVLLIDDVATSSATLDACAAALKQDGAARVYCLTLARAV